MGLIAHEPDEVARRSLRLEIQYKHRQKSKKNWISLHYNNIQEGGSRGGVTGLVWDMNSLWLSAERAGEWGKPKQGTDAHPSNRDHVPPPHKKIQSLSFRSLIDPINVGTMKSSEWLEID